MNCCESSITLPTDFEVSVCSLALMIELGNWVLNLDKLNIYFLIRLLSQIQKHLLLQVFKL